VYEIILDKELLPAAFRRKNSRYGNWDKGNKKRCGSQAFKII
jgi:hypothetical protein